MKRSRISPPMQLSLIFLLLSIIWIIVTDFLLLDVAEDIFHLARVQTFKGLAFVIIAAMVIYFVSRKIIKKQQQLQDSLNEERLLHKDLLAQEVFNAQEAERKELGAELHDNINQLLGVVKLYIEHAQVNPEAKDEMLTRSSQYLVQVINEIRGLSKALVSPTLSDIGLYESINEMVHGINKIRQIQIGMDKNNFSEEGLTEIQKLMVYRITQEQLNNILKHSKAEHVDISLKQTGSKVQLVIEDDGIGFDPNNIRSGLGLKNIRHRLELFNGRMKIETSPEQGCKLEAIFDRASRK